MQNSPSIKLKLLNVLVAFSIFANIVISFIPNTEAKGLDCTDAQAQNITATGTGSIATYTAPATNTIDGVCVKIVRPDTHGEKEEINGISNEDSCFEISGLGTDTVTVERIADPACSTVELRHIDAYYSSTPTVEFTTTTSSGAESTTPANIEVTLSRAIASDVTFDFNITGGTATDGDDFTSGTTSGTITAGNTTTTIPVTIIDDSTDEPDETIIAELSNPENASLGTNTQHTYTILDNDEIPTVQFTTTTGIDDELESSPYIEVSLSNPSASNVTFDYAITGGTATDGTDFNITGSTGTITAGNLTTTIPLTVINDYIDEVDETVEITISNPSASATLGTNTVFTYTITDPDANINVCKYNDLNRDGIKNENEPGIADWEIKITRSYNNVSEVKTTAQASPFIRELRTGVNGCVETYVEPDYTYKVEEIAQTKWVQTSPDGGYCESYISDFQSRLLSDTGYSDNIECTFLNFDRSNDSSGTQSGNNRTTTKTTTPEPQETEEEVLGETTDAPTLIPTDSQEVLAKTGLPLLGLGLIGAVNLQLGVLLNDRARKFVFSFLSKIV